MSGTGGLAMAPLRSLDAFHAWKRADEAARAAEKKLRTAWEQYEAKTGSLPSAELMAEVSALRDIANDKLMAAMAALRAARA